MLTYSQGRIFCLHTVIWASSSLLLEKGALSRMGSDFIATLIISFNKKKEKKTTLPR